MNSIDKGVHDAASRAARDRAGVFVVYVDGSDVCVRDSKAAPPRSATGAPVRAHCCAQFWSETPLGDAVVELRFKSGSEFRTVEEGAL